MLLKVKVTLRILFRVTEKSVFNSAVKIHDSQAAENRAGQKGIVANFVSGAQTNLQGLGVGIEFGAFGRN